MTEATKMRDQIAAFAKSIYDRGLTSGSTGNISARLSDGTILMTPTGSSMGFLDPARISHLSTELTLLSGDKPTKEIPLHSAFYDTDWRENGLRSFLPTTGPSLLVKSLKPRFTLWKS